MLRSRDIRMGVAVAVAAVAVAGCGGDTRPTARTAPAQPYSALDTTGGAVARVTPADYRRPIAEYKRYVGRELGALAGEVGRLRAAIARGDLAATRAAWLRADARYEAIGAAYGAFGDLDAAINGRPGGLPGGVRSADFTGLHRVELALWSRRSTRDAARPAAALDRAVHRLRARLPGFEIDPLEYSLRAHEILEDGIHLQLSGQASPWSGAALVALRSEVRGTDMVLSTLAPMITRRDTGGALPQARRTLRRLDGVLRGLERRDRSLPRWDRLSQRDRELVAGVTAAAAEHLAYVPELIDPRPARPAQRAFGDAG
jgi:iron uptake system EfeUOB component EfeO/EfeM